MREEQDFLDWTQEQDDRLRGALGTLRDDVDAAGIPDVRFVMQRAGRRRHRALAGVAAGAAAVLGLSWLGFQSLDGATTAPPAGTSTVTEQVTEEVTGTAVDAAPPAADDLLLAEGGGPDLNLFVPPALWASEVFTGEAATEAGQGEFESTALIDCDTDDVLWGAEDEGTFGVMGIWSEGSAFGTQRVRVLASPDAAASYTVELGEALAGCVAPAEADNIDYQVQPLDLAGAYRVTTTFRDGTDPLTDFYYVVQHEGTPEAVSTFRVADRSAEATDAEAAAELQRLAGLVTGR